MKFYVEDIVVMKILLNFAQVSRLFIVVRQLTEKNLVVIFTLPSALTL